MKKYEYKVTTIATTIPITTKGYEKIIQEFETKLNELGSEGWEFVQRVDSLFFFKRELEQTRICQLFLPRIAPSLK